jgi:flagellar basal-body rod protein FlgG
MIRALWTAASGMNAQQTNIDVIANNLANVNTAGYKASTLQFEDLMYATERPPGNRTADGVESPVGLQVGYGSRATATTRAFTQGELQRTQNVLDVAISGRGFFQVQLPDGTFAYTRDGSFARNADGQIVTKEGYSLVGAPQLDPAATEISILRDGTVTQVINNSVQQAGQILLSNFTNPEGLRSLGGNLFAETETSGAAETGITPGSNGTGALAQGYVEMSNVKIVEEMVRMIQAQRAYEINSKAINSADEMLGIANNLRR